MQVGSDGGGGGRVDGRLISSGVEKYNNNYDDSENRKT